MEERGGEGRYRRGEEDGGASRRGSAVRVAETIKNLKWGLGGGGLLEGAADQGVRGGGRGA